MVIWSGWGEQSPAFELYHQWWDELEREQGIKVTHVSLKNEVMIQQANRSLVLGGAPALFQSFGGFGLALQGLQDHLQDLQVLTRTLQGPYTVYSFQYSGLRSAKRFETNGLATRIPRIPSEYTVDTSSRHRHLK